MRGVSVLFRALRSLPAELHQAGIPLTEYSTGVIVLAYEVEYTDEFADWWHGLTAAEQNSVASAVGLLEDKGPQLDSPHSSAVYGSRHGHMRELRVQHAGRPYRVLYAFDPRRMAILYDQHLLELGMERTSNRRR